MSSALSNATMEAVPADLRGLAEQGLAEARRELENHGNIGPVFLVRNADGSIDRAQLTGAMGELMNYSQAKDELFGFIRRFVKVRGVTAVMFITDTWIGLPTAEHERLAREEPEKLRAIADSPDFSLDKAEGMGLVTRAQALCITVQDADQVSIINQFYERDEVQRRISYGQRTVMSVRQDEFRGRQKMFGVKSEADIR